MKRQSSVASGTMVGMLKEWRGGFLEKVFQDMTIIWTKVNGAVKARTGYDLVEIFRVLGLLFLVIVLIYRRGREFVCNLIGFVYPVYASNKAVETAKKDDVTKWVTYWIIYAIFSLVDFFSDYFLHWLPSYWLLKCLFLIFCMLPFRWNGSIFIYKRIIRPIFLKHQQKIDSAVDAAAEAGGNLVDEATGRRRNRKLIGRRDKEEEDAKDATAGAEKEPPSVSEEDSERDGILRGKGKRGREEEHDD